MVVIGTVTAVSASLVSCTVTVTDAPSATVWAAEAKLTSNGVGRSSSSIDTTLCAVVPAAHPCRQRPERQAHALVVVVEAVVLGRRQR